MPEDSIPPFEAFIASVGALPNNGSRNETVRGCPVRLQEFTALGRLVEGDLVRIRMDQLPLRAELAGPVSPIDLDDDEGLGEETAFLYDVALRVLAIQRNRTGVSASALMEYCERKAGLRLPIVLTPVLQLDAMQRLMRMQVVRTVEVAFAGPDNGALFRGLDVGLEGLARLQQEMQAPRASFTLSMGHKGGTLALDRAKGLAQALLSNFAPTETPVTKLLLKGCPDGEEMTALDLLQDRMVGLEDVELGGDRRVDYGKRSSALRAAWEKQREALGQQFSQ
jgi:hypothetical protein